MSTRGGLQRVSVLAVVLLGAAAAAPAGALAACSSFSESPPADDGDAATVDAASADVILPDVQAPHDAADAGEPPCNGTPDCSRLVFVTTQAFAATLGGIEGADTKCQVAAITSERIDLKTRRFMAWLSTEGTSPSARFPRSSKPYRRVDGTIIATDFDGLRGGTLLAPINQDEHGQTVAGDVWTGTTAAGAAEGMHCANWALAAGSAVVGSADQSGPAWTKAKTLSCDATARLYCFER